MPINFISEFDSVKRFRPRPTFRICLIDHGIRPPGWVNFIRDQGWSQLLTRAQRLCGDDTQYIVQRTLELVDEEKSLTVTQNEIIVTLPPLPPGIPVDALPKAGPNMYEMKLEYDKQIKRMMNPNPHRGRGRRWKRRGGRGQPMMGMELMMDPLTAAAMTMPIDPLTAAALTMPLDAATTAAMTQGLDPATAAALTMPIDPLTAQVMMMPTHTLPMGPIGYMPYVSTSYGPRPPPQRVSVSPLKSYAMALLSDDGAIESILGRMEFQVGTADLAKYMGLWRQMVNIRAVRVRNHVRKCFKNSVDEYERGYQYPEPEIPEMVPVVVWQPATVWVPTEQLECPPAPPQQMWNSDPTHWNQTIGTQTIAEPEAMSSEIEENANSGRWLWEAEKLLFDFLRRLGLAKEDCSGWLLAGNWA